eukprot:jgi/Mesvir1/26765/Mv20541-RA.1
MQKNTGKVTPITHTKRECHCPTCNEEAFPWEIVPDANWERKHCVKCIDWDFAFTNLDRPKTARESNVMDFDAPLQIELRQQERAKKLKDLKKAYRQRRAQLEKEEAEDTILNPKGHPFITPKPEMEVSEGEEEEEESEGSEEEEGEEELEATEPWDPADFWQKVRDEIKAENEADSKEEPKKEEEPARTVKHTKSKMAAKGKKEEEDDDVVEVPKQEFLRGNPGPKRAATSPPATEPMVKKEKIDEDKVVYVF